MIVSFRDTIPEQYRQMIAAYFNGMILNGIAASKQSKGLTMQADYAKSKIPVKAKAPENVVVPAEPCRSIQGILPERGDSPGKNKDGKNSYPDYS